MELLIDRIDSALGKILLVSDGERLCALDYAGYENRMMTLLRRRDPDFQLQDTIDPQGFSSLIRAYLAGDHCLYQPYSRQHWRHCVSAAGVVGVTHDPARNSAHVWRVGSKVGETYCLSCCRHDEWAESDRYCRSLPSVGGRKWGTDWLRWWPGA